jgi:uncharacterized pyridoxamine 5'-phosphate oxidase family protein
MMWQDFVDQAPALAEFCVTRLHGQVAYLATTRSNGAPRVHPVTPIIGGGYLFIFMEPTSPKVRDLQRDPRFALHNGVSDTSGESGEVSLAGTARLVTDIDLRTMAVQHTPYEPAERYVLFVCTPDRVMTSTYGAEGAHRQRWQRPE